MTHYNHWFIRARLKTRQLLLLLALAEEGNIHRAAQVLNMSQPAASKLLKDLEDVLEVVCVESFFELNGHTDTRSFGDATECFDQVGEHGVFNFEVWVIEEVLAVFVA
jgi:hypothetical protein